LVFHSSNITMMHGPLSNRCALLLRKEELQNSSEQFQHTCTPSSFFISSLCNETVIAAYHTAFSDDNQHNRCAVSGVTE